MIKSQLLVFLFGGWIVLVLAGLALLGSLEIVNFFILCLIGFLIIFDLSGPYTVRPKWKARVKNLTVLGILIFAAIAAVTLIKIIG